MRPVDADVGRARFHAERVEQAMVVVGKSVTFVNGDVKFVSPFDEIEAVHRFGNHGNILALGWRKQAIALRIRPMSIKAILRQQPSTWPDRSMKETPGKRALTTRFEAAVVTLGCTKSHPVLRSGFEFQRTILPSLVCVSSTYDRTCMLSI